MTAPAELCCSLPSIAMFRSGTNNRQIQRQRTGTGEAVETDMRMGDFDTPLEKHAPREARKRDMAFTACMYGVIGVMPREDFQDTNMTSFSASSPFASQYSHLRMLTDSLRSCAVSSLSLDIGLVL
jgi:hypothetical protein